MLLSEIIFNLEAFYKEHGDMKFTCTVSTPDAGEEGELWGQHLRQISLSQIQSLSDGSYETYCDLMIETEQDT